jgi:hypothetical protein
MMRTLQPRLLKRNKYKVIGHSCAGGFFLLLFKPSVFHFHDIAVFAPLALPAVKKLPGLTAPFYGAALVAGATMHELSHIHRNPADHLTGEFVDQLFADARGIYSDHGEGNNLIFVPHMPELDLHVLFEAFEIAFKAKLVNILG